nr:IS66 family insertion sequence element accessory protein TnpB [Paracoccus shanxieyensis]
MQSRPRGGLGGGAEEGAVIFPDQAVRIVIATKPVDFRKGHDGLAAMAHAELGFAPRAGVMVVFRSKRGDRIKVLFWDGSGIVMIYKRLEQGGFAWPKVGDGVMRLSRVQFEALFAGLD